MKVSMKVGSYLLLFISFTFFVISCSNRKKPHDDKPYFTVGNSWIEFYDTKIIFDSREGGLSGIYDISEDQKRYGWEVINGWANILAVNKSYVFGECVGSIRPNGKHIADRVLFTVNREGEVRVFLPDEKNKNMKGVEITDQFWHQYKR
jgi:hypothetical protein